MEKIRNILIVGTGSLAAAVGAALAPTGIKARITFAGRSPKSVLELAHASGASRASMGRVFPIFEALPADVSSAAGFLRLYEETRPDYVVLCASYHSPAEGLQHSSAWTDLLQSTEFGLTLPLQTGIAINAARALASWDSNAKFFNGCYPDAVNPVLTSLGLPVFAGLGNVAVLDSALRDSLGISCSRRLATLGHHAHLVGRAAPIRDIQAWVDDKPMEGVALMLKGIRGVRRDWMHTVTGFSFAGLIRELFTTGEAFGSLPGPNGLPGGYPVRLTDETVELRLPPSLSLEQAIAFNRDAAAADGIRVSDSFVAYSSAIQEALGPLMPRWSDGFSISKIAAVEGDMLRLRKKLRDCQSVRHGI